MSDRNKSVSFNDFLTGYVAGCKEGLTQEQIAAKIGMAVSSFRTRLVAVRKKVTAAGKKLPEAARPTGVTRNVDKTAQVAVMNELLADLDPVDPPQDEQAGETAPAGEAEATA